MPKDVSRLDYSQVMCTAIFGPEFKTVRQQVFLNKIYWVRLVILLLYMNIDSLLVAFTVNACVGACNDSVLPIMP